MKNVFIVICLILSSDKMTSAQTIRANAKIVGKRTTFITGNVSMNRLTIAHENSLYFNNDPKINIDNNGISGEKVDENSLLNSFNQTFSQLRLKELLTEGLGLNFYVNSQGQVLEISFVVHQGTKITPIELEELENNIKMNVKFKYKEDLTKGVPFFHIVQGVNFGKVLNGTLR